MGLTPPHQPAAMLLLLRRAGRVRLRGQGGRGGGGALRAVGAGPTGATRECQASAAALQGRARILILSVRPKHGAQGDEISPPAAGR